MLTRLSRLASAFLTVVAMLAAVGTLTAASMTSASAADEVSFCKAWTADGTLYWKVCGSGGTGGPGPGGGGTSEPTCDLSGPTYNDYCADTIPCMLNDPAKASEDLAGEYAGPKPGDDYHLAFRSCQGGADIWFWTKGEGPSLPELALDAFGNLPFPEYTPTFNPPNRTIVNLDTWWWATGASTDDLVGTSAGPVNAIATPARMEIDPGDGRGVFRCDFVTAKSDDCFHTYRRASVRGTATAPDGSKAYPARMRLVWDVRFENNGTPFEADGLPSVFTSPWETVAVPVREIQTVVRPGR